MGVCAAAAIGLGTVHADGGVIFLQSGGAPCGSRTGGKRQEILCSTAERLCSIGGAAAGVLSRGGASGGDAGTTFKSWLPKAVGQDHNRQECEGYLLRRRSDDGFEKTSGPTRQKEWSTLRRPRYPMGRQRVA